MELIKPEKGVYKLNVPTGDTCMLANEKESNTMVWHRRFGHLNFGMLRKLNDVTDEINVSGDDVQIRLIGDRAICMIASIDEINDKLHKFWEMGNIPDQCVMTSESQQCINHFESTIKRGLNGIYTVSLPFKTNAHQLGDSRKMALAQFFQLERKFARVADLKKLYTNYMEEMIQREYMAKCEKKSTHKKFVTYRIIRYLRTALHQRSDQCLMQVVKREMENH